MADIPARALRNDVSAVLRRAEGGERLRVLVNGRPVAQLGPLPHRATSLPWDAIFGSDSSWQADPGLAAELARLLPETTDELPIP